MADPIGQNFSVPEETTVIVNDVNPITQSSTPPVNSSSTPPADNKKGLRVSRKVVATLFGILLLVGAVGAGVALVGNQQHLDQKAAEGGGCTQTGSTIDCTGTGPYHVTTCHSTTNTGTSYPSCATNDNCTTQIQNGPLHLTVSTPSCGSNQVDVQELGGGICSGSGSACITGNACGIACTSDSDCRNPSTSGAAVACRGGTCQNVSCVGKTIPGANCDCGTLNACGQPCSASVGLCQTGSECGFITTASQCLGAEGNTTKQFCLPTSPNNGYTKAQCSGIAASYLVNSSGQSGTPPLTQQDVIQACAPQVTASPSPTASPTASATPITAQCTNIKAYDTNWKLLTATDLSKLAAGNVVRFTVTGTTTGTFDKARFTINGTLKPETTLHKPVLQDFEANTFYYEYTIPANTASFTVSAQIFSVELKQWF